MSRTIRVLAAVVLVVAQQQTRCAGADVAEVLSAWANRAAGIQTARVSWTQITIRAMDSVDGSLQYQALHTYTCAGGQRRRYEITGQQPHPDLGVMSINNIYTDNGATDWRLFTPQCDQVEFPVGFVNSSAWGNRDLYPWLWVLGRASTSMALSQTGLQLIDDSYRDPGARHACWLLEELVDERRRRTRKVVVDPQREFALVRVVDFDLRDGASSQWELSYEGREPDDWIPSRWTYTSQFQNPWSTEQSGMAFAS